PDFHLLSVPAQSNVVRLSVAQGLTLEPLRLWQLQLRSATPTPHPEWVYETTQAEYAGHFQLRKAATRLEVRSLTLLEAADQKLTFTATVECAALQGELRTLSVRLRNWDGDEVRLEAPRVAQRQERRGDSESRL